MLDFQIIHMPAQVYKFSYKILDYSNIEQMSIRQTNPNNSISNNRIMNTENIFEEKKDTEDNKK